MPIADIGTANSVRVPPAFFDFRGGHLYP